MEKHLNILEEAAKLVSSERNARYGHPKVAFAQIAAGWKIVLGIDVTPVQVGQCLVMMKICRHIQRPEHTDSLTDIAGYARTLEMLGEKQEEPQQ